MMLIFLVVIALNCGLSDTFAALPSSSTPSDTLAELNDSTTPQVYVSGTQIAFERIIISLINKPKLAYIIFDLEVNRMPSQAEDIGKEVEAQNKRIPEILNFVITDISTALELFWNGVPHEGLPQTINKRLTRKLKQKYPWVKDTLILNFKLQDS